jgi:hypothetical protein
MKESTINKKLTLIKLADLKPTVCGVGYSDVNATYKEGRQLKSYVTWKDMLKRCYSSKCQEIQPTYIGCTVADEWKYYSNFKKFYDKHYREGFQIDKDILFPGNKIYSKKTCRFIPEALNLLLVDSANTRGSFPLGVSRHRNKFQAICRIPPVLTDKEMSYKKRLGLFSTPEDAAKVYRLFKDSIIKQCAYKYFEAGLISIEIRDALLSRVS